MFRKYKVNRTAIESKARFLSAHYYHEDVGYVDLRVLIETANQHIH